MDWVQNAIIALSGAIVARQAFKIRDMKRYLKAQSMRKAESYTAWLDEQAKNQGGK